MNLGVVSRVDLRQAVLLTPTGQEMACWLRARLLDAEKRVRGAIVAGDEVEWEIDEQGTPVVEEVLPRRNAFVRRATGRVSRPHVVAANLDQVVMVAALAEPPFRERLVDRVALAAVTSRIPLCLVLSKTDLVPSEEAGRTAAAHRKLGYPVHAVSAVSGEGIGELEAALRGGRSLMVGHSGVGKSTLLNSLSPGLGLRIGGVNPTTGRGRQTTAWAQLFRLADGTEIVDTPGFRSFTPWGADEPDLLRIFPELGGLAGECRFRDCTHREEPDCAVTREVEEGRFDRARYESYLKLLDELEQESPA